MSRQPDNSPYVRRVVLPSGKTIEVVYFGAVWLYLGGWTASASSGEPDRFYWVAILVRVAGELYLAGMVVRDILQPWRDPVRADGVTDDPAEPSCA